MTIEERVGVVENDIAHIKADVSEIKGDLRRLDDKVERLAFKVDGVKDSVATLALNTEKLFSTSLRWTIGLQVTMAFSIIAALASGFLWLANKIS